MNEQAQLIAGRFYDGVLEPGAWYAAMDDMCTHLQAGIFHGFTLFSGETPTPESVGNVEEFGLQARNMAEYETEHAGNDLRLMATLGLAPGEIMLDHEHVSEAEALRNSVYADWLIPLGLKHTAGVVVRTEGSARELVSFIRPRDAKPFSLEDKRFIEQLMPDITRAAKLRAGTLALSRSASLGMAALETLRQCVAVVDLDCRIHHANAAAEKLLAQSSALAVRYGRLHCAHAKASGRLVQLVRGACALPGKAGALILGDGERRLTLNILPLNASHICASQQQAPMAMVIAAVSGAAPHLDPHLMREMLGLSPTEAQLALSLVKGETVKDFASEGDMSWHTARTHLKNLLRKTGCHRQVELLQLLQSLQG
ncbi:helix-turn-helix transcriptional regulator [Ottowia thiooxydans]|uniref:helix-turn-helix transcriptional regulator n=1 Tax=Ottowia thiooxydans TaxID=219182 RepID=UPI0004004405|nr:LuxR C-terminal-related transcriptional regulator [Ottowia thiooxydans]